MAAPILSATPTIISSWFCPFAQRVLMAANAKKLTRQFQVHDVSFDLLYNNKPQWLLDLNPSGLVPLIAWKEEGASNSTSSSSSSAIAAVVAGPGIVCVRESLVCNEYLEDTYPQEPLLPADPIGRAAARILIQRISDEFVTAFKRVLITQHGTQSEQDAAAAALDMELTWLLAHMTAPGPFALSDQLSLVDCAVAPHLIRLYILRHYADYRYKGPAQAKLREYCKALESHPAAAASMVHPEGMDYKAELLKVYAHYGVSLVFNHRTPLW